MDWMNHLEAGQLDADGEKKPGLASGHGADAHHLLAQPGRLGSLGPFPMLLLVLLGLRLDLGLDNLNVGGQEFADRLTFADLGHVGIVFATCQPKLDLIRLHQM